MEDTVSRDFEDDVTMQSSTGSIDIQCQKENLYNKLLPYADDLEAESQAVFAEIKANLGRAVMLSEIRVGCGIWTTRLCKYIKIYGMKFSKEDHILLIKLMYELVTMPKLEPWMVNKFASTLILLLKKKELISPEELELPWEPIFRLTQRIMETGETVLGMYRYLASLEAILDALVHAVKVYFPVSATREILDELRPYLYPFTGNTMSATLETLEWFLPLQLPPKHHSLGHQLWFNEFMTLWEVCHNAPRWEGEMMWLMARLASNNIGYIDWEPHMPLMFTRFVRCLNLPVSYKQTASLRSHRIPTSAIAMWIASVLGHGSSSQDYLDKFLRTIETYFHPANFGRWLTKLKELLRKLPFYFITRLHKERYGKSTWETPVPESHKLTDLDIDRFVKSMKPVVMTAMFGKLGINDASIALQHLSTMRPNLIIPDVLGRLFSTFDSLTEPHKLTASMICVVAVARPMVQGSRYYNSDYSYPEGPSHVLPLLFSTLPGIDPNDARKCFVTFRLISAFATLVPIVDSSRSHVATDEDERIICEETSRFEDFILQFLDRVFALIDSSSLEFVRLESRVGDGKSKLESMSESALAGVCTSLLTQTSGAIFDCALRKLRSFITERVLETKVAGQLAAVMCRTFARVNGRETLRVLIPPLSQTILDMVREGDITKEENLDNQLLYAMLLLSQIVDTTGNHLLPHINTLTEVLDKTLHLKSREGSQIASRLLKRLLLSLSTVTPSDYRSLTEDYDDPDYLSIRDWGKAVEIDSLNIKWYVPGEEEVATITRIFSRYLPPEVARIESYIADKGTLTREELLTSLSVVNAIIGGCESMLPVWSEPAIRLVESSSPWTSFTPMLGIKAEVRMPDGSNTRRYLAALMCALQAEMLKNAEDDIKSLFALVEIWNSLLLGKVRPLDDHETRRKNFHAAKTVLEDKLVGKKRHLRPFLVERAAIQHETRLQCRSHCLTVTHKRIMHELFKLATSRYGEVRARAQAKLFGAFQHFAFSYTVLTPQILEILGKDTEEHHDAFKGVLYILLGIKQNPLITTLDWALLNALWPALVHSKPSEKLSIIRLKETLVDTVHKLFPTMSIIMDVPSSCVKAASLFWDTDPKPSLPQPDIAEVQKGLQNLEKVGEHNMELYNGLLDELLHGILEGNLHWRQRLMAMSFIRDLIHPEQMYPAKVVRYFLSALIHDSLEERKIAIRTTMYILKQQKRKHAKIPVDPFKMTTEAPHVEDIAAKWNPGERSDNAWLQYDYTTRPLTEEQWDEPRFVHQPYMGYHTWPKQLKVYAPSSEQPCLDPNKRELSDREKEVDLFFNDPHNVEKLLRYLSLEEKKGKDKFNSSRFLLFKGLFRNHGSAHLRHFLPHLRRLVSDKHESSQRCAAEIVAGLIRGAKHWPFRMTSDMWDVLLPIVRTALANLTVETVEDWGVCFATSQERRDPNRQHWLLECLMEEPPLGESEASFVECGRLYALQGALSQQSWRVSQLFHRLLARFEDRLMANPFQNVRERLGSMLAMVFGPDLKFLGDSTESRLAPRVQDLIDKVMPRLQRLAEDAPATTADQDKSLSSLVDKVHLDDSLNGTKDEEREGAIRLLKTVCKWLICSIGRLQYGALPGYYQLFPIVSQLENCETDEELSKTCSGTLAVLAQVLTLPCHVPAALEAVTKVSESNSWWARATSLEFLQVLVFHNMSIILSDAVWVGKVRDTVLRLLEDERLEVRDKAGKVLGGLLHCAFIPDQEILLEEFKVKAKTRIHKRKRHGVGEEEGRDKSAEMAAIRVRHTGVLGLCAFVNAHPYDVPPFLPPVFEELGPHLNDPQPIPTTIRKTLGDFKRTHYDGWAGLTGHEQRFTEEQLSVLQDLAAPPSYYA